MINIDNKFEYGSIVYLKTDEDQIPRMVTGFEIRDTLLIYYLSCGEKETEHHEVEITADKNILTKLGV